MRVLESEIDKPNSWRRYSLNQKMEAIKSEYSPGISASALAVKVGKYLSKDPDLKITRMSIIAFYHRNEELRTSHPLNLKTQAEITKTAKPKPETKVKVLATCWADFSVKHKLSLFKEVYRPGFTLQNIADALAARLGDGTITRNAISAFYGRNKEALTGWDLQDTYKASTVAPQGWVSPENEEYDLSAPKFSGADHNSKIHCSFIFEDRTYCGYSKMGGRTEKYCSHHRKRVYLPGVERKATYR
jgi:hypothetical protein